MTRFYRAIISFFALAVCLLSLSQISSANSIIYNSLGVGKTFNTGSGFTIAGSSSQVGAQIIPAMEFTSKGNFDLAQIDVAIGWVAGTDSVTLTLNADSHGALGKQLETWTLSNLGAFGTNYTPEKVFGDGDYLAAHHQYWLVASPGASDTWAAWNLNSIGVVGAFQATDIPSGPAGGNSPDLPRNTFNKTYLTQTHGGFDVVGGPATVSPEPGTLLLIGTGICGLLARRRR